MIRPLGDNLVLRPLARPGMVGRLHMPDTGTLASATGVFCKVLAVGPKADEVKVGDVVHLKAYGTHPAGVEVRHEEHNLILIRQRDINGVVTGYKPAKEDEEWLQRGDWGMSVKQEGDE